MIKKKKKFCLVYSNSELYFDLSKLNRWNSHGFISSVNSSFLDIREDSQFLFLFKTFYAFCDGMFLETRPLSIHKSIVTGLKKSYSGHKNKTEMNLSALTSTGYFVVQEQKLNLRHRNN